MRLQFFDFANLMHNLRQIRRFHPDFKIPYKD